MRATAVGWWSGAGHQCPGSAHRPLCCWVVQKLLGTQIYSPRVPEHTFGEMGKMEKWGQIGGGGGGIWIRHKIMIEIV